MIDPRGTFQLEQRPAPAAGPGAVVVRVRAAGLNAADLQQARGDCTTIRGRSPAEKVLLAATVRTSVVPLLAQGRLGVPVDAAFPLARFADAYAAWPDRASSARSSWWP